MRNKFGESVGFLLKKHGVEDEKLEQALSDLFDSFENHLLNGDFVKEVTQKQNRATERRRRMPRTR